MGERLPFDPARIRRPSPPSAAGPTLLSVRQVNDLVRGAIAAHLPPTLHVLGLVRRKGEPPLAAAGDAAGI